MGTPDFAAVVGRVLMLERFRVWRLRGETGSQRGLDRFKRHFRNQQNFRALLQNVPVLIEQLHRKAGNGLRGA